MLDESPSGSRAPRRTREEPSQRASATARTVQALRRELSQGSWAAGDRLPSEPALAAELGVSRVTIRAALAKLESEGLVNRRHGSGTYVNSVRPLVNSLHINTGADQLIKSTGHVPGIAEMSWRQTEADEDIADRLGIEIGAPIIHLYRIRTADGTPVTVAQDYFPASLLPEGPVSMGPSLYAFLSDVCGVDVSFGVATVEPALAGAAHASIFEGGSDALCLVIRQVDYDETERPVSYSVEYHLASAFDFKLVRQGPVIRGAKSKADQRKA
ncbi:GntR family transcriptional regulator [Streptomyces sp. NPDC005336]|uniref:GntR family transcriptional regulator n=1 Tax=Streptomyces sp. NPDC005336 TaxID=3157035 RepID=UPI0033AEFFA9